MVHETVSKYQKAQNPKHGKYPVLNDLSGNQNSHLVHVTEALFSYIVDCPALSIPICTRQSFGCLLIKILYLCHMIIKSFVNTKLYVFFCDVPNLNKIQT